MNHPLRSMAASSILALCAAMAGTSTAFAQPAALAAVYVEADAIIIEPTVPYELSITIVGPNDLRIEEAFGPGGPVQYSVGALADGYYKYEISILSMNVDPGVSQTAALQMGTDENGRSVSAAAALGTAVSPVNRPTRQSGGFRVLKGVTVDPSARD